MSGTGKDIRSPSTTFTETFFFEGDAVHRAGQAGHHLPERRALRRPARRRRFHLQGRGQRAARAARNVPLHGQGPKDQRFLFRPSFFVLKTVQPSSFRCTRNRNLNLTTDSNLMKASTQCTHSKRIKRKKTKRLWSLQVLRWARRVKRATARPWTKCNSTTKHRRRRWRRRRWQRRRRRHWQRRRRRRRRSNRRLAAAGPVRTAAAAAAAACRVSRTRTSDRRRKRRNGRRCRRTRRRPASSNSPRIRWAKDVLLVLQVRSDQVDGDQPLNQWNRGPTLELNFSSSKSYPFWSFLDSGCALSYWFSVEETTPGFLMGSFTMLSLALIWFYLVYLVLPGFPWLRRAFSLFLLRFYLVYLVILGFLFTLLRFNLVCTWILPGFIGFHFA